MLRVLANKILSNFCIPFLQSMCLGMGWRCKAIQDWYTKLNKPSWTPPNWVFGPVWTILYICIAVAGWIIFTEKKVPLYVKIAFIIQLIGNIFWSSIFFDMQCPRLAMLDLIVMWSANFYCLHQTYQKMQNIFLLLLPYQLWMTYAASINMYVAIYN